MVFFKHIKQTHFRCVLHIFIKSWDITVDIVCREHLELKETEELR